ncbi:hypothetical protein BB561_005175 [Smittium simulii]|uniref:DUF4211 domain-containing protein n=1 Tax=Smittium simulii TaxID=133385 RepID=A0A2T9YBN7_9FUNG|nr:hypothetical protein BB561_005175 [Smittium simulii]
MSAFDDNDDVSFSSNIEFKIASVFSDDSPLHEKNSDTNKYVLTPTKELSVLIENRPGKSAAFKNAINLYKKTTFYDFNNKVIKGVHAAFNNSCYVLVESKPNKLDKSYITEENTTINNMQKATPNQKLNKTVVKKYSSNKKIKPKYSIKSAEKKTTPGITKTKSNKKISTNSPITKKNIHLKKSEYYTPNFNLYSTAPDQPVYVKIKKNKFTNNFCKKVTKAIQQKFDRFGFNRESKPSLNSPRRLVLGRSLASSSFKRQIRLVISSEDESSYKKIDSSESHESTKPEKNFFKNKYNTQPSLNLNNYKNLSLGSDENSSSDDYLSLSKKLEFLNANKNSKNDVSTKSDDNLIQNSKNDVSTKSDDNLIQNSKIYETAVDPLIESNHIITENLVVNSEKENIIPTLFSINNTERKLTSSHNNLFDTLNSIKQTLNLQDNISSDSYELNNEILKKADASPVTIESDNSDSSNDSNNSDSSNNAEHKTINYKLKKNNLLHQFKTIGVEVNKILSDYYPSSDSSEDLPNITSQSLRPNQRIRKKPTYSELVEKMKNNQSSSSESKYTYFSDDTDDIEDTSQSQRSKSTLYISSSDSSFIKKNKKIKLFKKNKNRGPKSKIQAHKRKGGHMLKTNKEKRSIGYSNAKKTKYKSSSEDGNLSDFIVSDNEIIEESGIDYYNNSQFTDLATIPSYNTGGINLDSHISNNPSSSILQQHKMFMGADFETLFSGYAQYLIHRILNNDILDKYDNVNLEYFKNSESLVERKIQSIKDSLVSSSVWHDQYVKDISNLPVFYDSPIMPEPGCEVCNYGRSRTSTFNVYLIGSQYLFELYTDIKPSMKLKFDKKRSDLAFYRFNNGKLDHSILANLNIISNTVKDKIDSGEIRYFSSADVKKLNIYGVCYKMGKTCHQRSRLYHFLHHYTYNLAMRLTQEMEDICGNIEMTDLGVTERIHLVEEIVSKLDGKNLIKVIHDELTNKLDSAISL